MNNNPMGITGVISMIPILLLPALVATCVAIVPWVTGRREVFGVTVPPAALADARIRRYRVAFSTLVGGVGATSLLACVALWRLVGVTPAFWCASILSIVVVAVGFAAQQRFRRRVIAIKRERGWTATGAKRMAVVADDTFARPLSLWWDLVYVVVIAATIIVGYAGYGGMPQRVPIHTNAAGIVDGWADKSPFVIWFAPLTELILAAVMVGAHAAVLYARRPVDVDSPVRSARRYAAMARAWSVYVLVVGVAVTAGVGMTVQLGTIGVLDLGAVGLAGTFAGVLALVGGIVVVLFYGQNGSRVDAGGADDETMPWDEDRYWYGGVIYANRDDPAVWVPKRFGVGWTVNMARPVVWVGAVILLLVAIGLPFALSALL